MSLYRQPALTKPSRGKGRDAEHDELCCPPPHAACGNQRMQAVRQAATAGGNRKRKASDKRLDEDEVHRDYSSTVPYGRHRGCPYRNELKKSGPAFQYEKPFSASEKIQSTIKRFR